MFHRMGLFEMQTRIEALEAERERLKELLRNYIAVRWVANTARVRSRLWNVEADLARLRERAAP
jgi:hypothetical protein